MHLTLSYIKRLTLLLAFFYTCSCSHQLIIPEAIKHAADHPQKLTTAFETLTHSPWTSGNEVTPLHNGENFYPRMLTSIQNAKQSITFETFAFVSGPVSYEFAKALAQKADSGIPVHIIIDAIGSKDAGPCLTILKNSAAQVTLYRPVLKTSPLKVNHRDHRKILIVDGSILYTGGAGFAQSWIGNGRSPNQWRDSQFLLQGPCVLYWQIAFVQHWKQQTGESLSGPAYFPPLLSTGTADVQTVMDSSKHKPSPTGTSILFAIHSAQSSIDLQQSYFVPTPEIVSALLEASSRGVKVRILTPSENIDFPLCRTACRLLSKPLVKNNIQLYEYQPSMMHAKIMLVDQHLAIVGSGNIDPRSFFINLESNLHIISPPLVRDLRNQFEQDLQLSEPVPEEDTGWLWPQFPKQLFAWSIRQQL